MEMEKILRINAKIKNVEDAQLRELGFCYSLLLVTAGNIHIDIDTRKFEIAQGELLILTPLSLVSILQVSDDFHASLLAIDRTSFGRIPNSSRFHSLLIRLGIHKIAISDAIFPQISNTFSVFHSYLSQQHTCQEGLTLTLADFLLLQIIEELLPLQHSISLAMDHKNHLLQQFLTILSAHYKEEHGILYYADKLCVSTTYLSRIIRETTGKTAYYFIADKLLATARHHLACTDLSISDIAHDLHFSDQSAFGKFFKSRVGVPPVLYRERLGSTVLQRQ